jgi:hypothetical protein
MGAVLRSFFVDYEINKETGYMETWLTVQFPDLFPFAPNTGLYGVL